MFNKKALERIAQHQEFSPEDFGPSSNETIELDQGPSDSDSFNWVNELVEKSDEFEDRISILEQWINYLVGEKEYTDEEVSMLREQVQEIAKQFSRPSQPQKDIPDYSKMTDEEFYNSLGI